jgi:heme-degrading monooxygenase HmoA
MQRRIRVVIYLREPEGQDGVIEETYRKITWVQGTTPGLLRTELLRDLDEPDRYLLLTQWSQESAFRDWQNGPDHKDNPSPLRPYQDPSRGRHWAVYDVTSTD